SNGQSAPGHFVSGNVAVALGTTVLRYGMIGTVQMSEGTFNMSTPGGHHQSDAQRCRRGRKWTECANSVQLFACHLHAERSGECLSERMLRRYAVQHACSRQSRGYLRPR